MRATVQEQNDKRLSVSQQMELLIHVELRKPVVNERWATLPNVIVSVLENC